MNHTSHAGASLYRMPAEWETHRATWIAWPHEQKGWSREESDFPDKLEAVQWVYAEIVRILSQSELVEIIVDSEDVMVEAKRKLTLAGVKENLRFHLWKTDRSWLRDSLPTGVLDANGKASWVKWRYNAWAKYPNYGNDAVVADVVAKISGAPVLDISGDIVLEGGSIETDGEGTLITTEECLLSDVQQRNPGFDKSSYEEIFLKYLGVRNTIWLGRGCAGDDTHGHVDDLARFVRPRTVVLSYQDNPADADHAASADNLSRLQSATDASNRPLEVVRLPVPAPLYFDGDRLPASYANFYIGNSVVIVPTFNDVNDRKALNILEGLFPGRTVVGIHAVDLVLGRGTLHCLTQQEPLTRG